MTGRSRSDVITLGACVATNGNTADWRNRLRLITKARSTGPKSASADDFQHLGRLCDALSAEITADRHLLLK
jgi:hypothetical protein